MKIKKYKNIKAAIEKTTKESANYVFVRHILNPKDKIRLHYHEKANEFIIVDEGKFKIRLGDEEKTFDLKNQAITIYLPKRRRHTLIALSRISYFVFRDIEDTTIYCE